MIQSSCKYKLMNKLMKATIARERISCDRPSSDAHLFRSHIPWRRRHISSFAPSGTCRSFVVILITSLIIAFNILPGGFTLHVAADRFRQLRGFEEDVHSGIRPPSVPPHSLISSPQQPPTILYSSLRIVGGPDPSAGRLEIYNGSFWGTICDDAFGDREASVACRELGYSTGVALFQYYGTVFGPGTGPIMMDNVECYATPTPTRLYQCSFNGWGVHNCAHSEDVGVQCSGRRPSWPPSLPPSPQLPPSNPTPPPLPPTALYDVRLVVTNDGTGNTLLEVFTGQGYTNVCFTYMSSNFANIFCRQLGYGYASSYGVYFLTSQSSVALDTRACDEFSPAALFRIASCAIVVDAMSCLNMGTLLHCTGSSQQPPSPPPQPPLPPAAYLDVRLGEIEGMSNRPPFYGTMEFFNGQEWSAPCLNAISYTFADIFCRQVGYAYAMWYSFSADRRNGSMMILNITGCNRYPRPHTVAECVTVTSNPAYCMYSGIKLECSGTGPPFTPQQPPSLPAAGPMVPAPPQPLPQLPPAILYQLRLVGGSNPREGRLEIFNGTLWGTVCDDFFGNTEATVACRELGYDYGVAVQQWGGGTGPILLDNVVCSGYPSPERLYQCNSNGWGRHDCGHFEDVGVQCYGIATPSPFASPPQITTAQYAIRLVGGSIPSEGRVEIFDGAAWGTVCDDGFGNTEATVVCRQLGYESGVAAYQYGDAYWGQGYGPILMDDVSCSATQLPARLDLCMFSGWNIHNCGHFEDVGVRCSGSHQTIGFIPGLIGSSGGFHTCIISTQGLVKCFGYNVYGSLGLGDTQSRGDDANEMGSNLPTVDLGPGLNASVVVTGYLHSCVLIQSGGIIKCWGANQYGQLGLGDTAIRGARPGEMGTALPAVDLGPGLVAVALAAGSNHTCAILQPGGVVKCWGMNNMGQLGVGDTENRGSVPGQMGASLPSVPLGRGLQARAITAGSDFTCALLQPGSIVKCWGGNQYGQLGLGDTRSRGLNAKEMGDALPAVNLGRGYNTTAISAGQFHVCALLQPVGVIKCWGMNAYGSLGLGDAEGRGYRPGQMGLALRRVDLGPRVSAVAVAAGGYHSCALLQPGGKVKCWGDNSAGQLGADYASGGRGKYPNEMGDAVRYVDLGPRASIVSISAGIAHSCALLYGNSIKCWGINFEGASGVGSNVSLLYNSSPQLVDL